MWCRLMRIVVVKLHHYWFGDHRVSKGITKHAQACSKDQLEWSDFTSQATMAKQLCFVQRALKIALDEYTFIYLF